MPKTLFLELETSNFGYSHVFLSRSHLCSRVKSDPVDLTASKKLSWSQNLKSLAQKKIGATMWLPEDLEDSPFLIKWYVKRGTF